MTQPAVSTELVVAEPRLAVVPRRVADQRSLVADGWVLLCPIAGVAVGTIIREFGVFGAAGSLVGGLVLAAGVAASRRVVVRAEKRSDQFAARARLALPPGVHHG